MMFSVIKTVVSMDAAIYKGTQNSPIVRYYDIRGQGFEVKTFDNYKSNG